MATSRQLSHLEGLILPSFLTSGQVVFLFIITIKIISVAFMTPGSPFFCFLSRNHVLCLFMASIASLIPPLRACMTFFSFIFSTLSLTLSVLFVLRVITSQWLYKEKLISHSHQSNVGQQGLLWDPGPFYTVTLSSHATHHFQISSVVVEWEGEDTETSSLPCPGRDKPHFCSESVDLDLSSGPQQSVVEGRSLQTPEGIWWTLVASSLLSLLRCFLNVSFIQAPLSLGIMRPFRS